MSGEGCHEHTRRVAAQGRNRADSPTARCRQPALSSGPWSNLQSPLLAALPFAPPPTACAGPKPYPPSLLKPQGPAVLGLVRVSPCGPAGPGGPGGPRCLCDPCGVLSMSSMSSVSCLAALPRLVCLRYLPPIHPSFASISHSLSRLGELRVASEAESLLLSRTLTPPAVMSAASDTDTPSAAETDMDASSIMAAAAGAAGPAVAGLSHGRADSAACSLLGCLPAACAELRQPAHMHSTQEVGRIHQGWSESPGCVVRCAAFHLTFFGLILTASYSRFGPFPQNRL